MQHLQRFAVSYEYPVYFGASVFARENPALVDAITRREPGRLHRVLFVVEARVAALWPALLGDIAAYVTHHGTRLSLAGPPRIAPGGEECKNEARAAEELARHFDALGMDRQSFVVVVGGGALQDMAGYAASITHRGLRVIRVPTTVLAQNDSGIGVKNGVNAFGKKNFFGTFAPPFAVLDDVRFLETLEPRDRAAGMAEAVKVACIKDAPFFEWMEGEVPSLAAFAMPQVAELVRRCALRHLEHIATAGDPFELGSSRPLDFGHWAAHKLESLSNYELRHGEAVAIGIALDTRYSVEAGMLPEAEGERVVRLLARLGLPTWDARLELRAPAGERLVLEGIREFREHLGGELTVMLLERVGKGREVRALDPAHVESAILWLARRAAGRSASRAEDSAAE